MPKSFSEHVNSIEPKNPFGGVVLEKGQKISKQRKKNFDISVCQKKCSCVCRGTSHNTFFELNRTSQIRVGVFSKIHRRTHNLRFGNSVFEMKKLKNRSKSFLNNNFCVEKIFGCLLVQKLWVASCAVGGFFFENRFKGFMEKLFIFHNVQKNKKTQSKHFHNTCFYRTGHLG